ncbi:MAG TPA: ABC transporter permease, partial [Candidatus Saccharimonadales bacterium]|nr:ABC transporter permease [Candidatus Saccharimonadales bacterium]
LRARKPDVLGADSPIAPTDASALVLRQKVYRILPARELGNFNLTASQLPPRNAFVLASTLQEKAGLVGRANLLLAGEVGQTRLPLNSGFSLRAWLRSVSARLHLPFGSAPSALHLYTVNDTEALSTLNQAVTGNLGLDDWQLQLQPMRDRAELELRTPRVFLEPAIVEAAQRAAATLAGSAPPGQPRPAPSYGVLTYLANLIRHDEHTTPYSMVTATVSPLVPADLQDDEAILSQWLADDLQAGPGQEVEISYFVADQASQLLERTNRFRVRAVLPMTDPALDRSLMPEFPGIAQAERAGDWQTGFPLTYPIREKDDAYWKQYRGTPKMFITLAAGQRLWGNRFGNLTALRFPQPAAPGATSWYLHQTQFEKALLEALRGSTSGTTTNAGLSASIFHFEPVRAQALAASAPTQDFGGLFLGLSFFLILAALILMALLFQFGIEQRTAEVGTLLALGFRPGQVRWLLLGEGTAVALLGGALGMGGGLLYAKGMVKALTTLWREAVGMTPLSFHASPLTLFIGLFAGAIVSAVTIAVVLRQQARQPARVLLAGAGGAEASPAGPQRPGRKARWILGVCTVVAFGLIGWGLSQDNGSPEIFFGAGSLLLIGLLAGVSALLSWMDHAEVSRRLSLVALGLRNCTRRRTRSLATVALLACGSFLVVAVGANRLDAGREAMKRSSGTGGFMWVGDTTLPVVRDLNTKSGREFYNLNETTLAGVSVVPFRVRDGDEASCLNLNSARVPRLLGVRPELLAQRGAFSFGRVEKGRKAALGWNLLKPGLAEPALAPDEIPAIGDAASIQWALHRSLGDRIEYVDERGRKFKVRLVAGLANSILQGSLIIDEAEFVKRFPSLGGHRMFLIDRPSKSGSDDAAVARHLGQALQDVGLELVPAARRLAEFNAVQNTYLNTFQVLGAIGLLLGSAGLGVVVLRNVLERRGELGLLQAVGFRARGLRRLVLSEHAGLLGLGLGAGVLAALGALLPVLRAPGAELHQTVLVLTLAGVLVSGLVWTWCATAFALRGRLLDALRDE